MVSSAGVESFSAVLLRASGALETMLQNSERDVRAASVGFENLATDADRVLDVTAAIVRSVECECGRSILPLVQMLGDAARGFVGGRIDAVTATTQTFDNEAQLLEKLSQLTDKQHSIAKQGKVLSVLASIEVARLGGLGVGFQSLARELNEFAEMVSQGAEQMNLQAQHSLAGLEVRRQGLDQALDRMGAHLKRTETDLGGALEKMSRTVSDLSAVPAIFRECVEAVASQIGRVVAAIQMRDASRQQTEHVRDALRATAADIGNDEELGGTDRARAALLLQIQAAQLVCVRQSMRNWVGQIGECLESIVKIGSSDVAAIGAKIQQQEQELSAQVKRIEELKQESEADDAQMAHCLEGLDGLIGIGRAYVERSRQVRDRMQILNFNSMIQARHLGSKAAAVLEIARSISRMTDDWGELTDSSGSAMDELLSSAAQTEAATHSFAQAGGQKLQEAEEQCGRCLASLETASAAASENGASVTQAVDRLRGNAQSLGGIAVRLQELAGETGNALLAIEEMQRELETGGDESGAAGIDRKEIEVSCAAAYTCEVERQVLRAVLYGEPMPSADASSAGNDVELF